MPVDLHLHTTASDGSMSPSRVVEIAKKANLHTIAISDHDTVAGIEEALEVGNRLGVTVIPAVEFSSRYGGKDMHILGYYVDYTNADLLSALAKLQAERAARVEKIVACLQTQGLEITADEVKDAAGGGALGRPHIARVLLAKGYVPTFYEAFAQHLKRGAPCFIEKFVFEPDEAIRLIHAAGGLAVFAHPGLSQLDEHIPELVAMGLDGLEAYHSEHASRVVEHYRQLAARYNLIVTGGSDCHGRQSTHGIRLGVYTVPDVVAEGLKARVQGLA